VFSGGQNQRPDLMRKLFDQYQAANPGVKVEIETGGATSELQRQYLSTVLNAKDSAIDIYMIDIVNPAQYFGAGWLEPLDAYVGPAGEVLKPYLPVYAQSNVVDGKVAALPGLPTRCSCTTARTCSRSTRSPSPRPGTNWPPRPARIQAAEGRRQCQPAGPEHPGRADRRRGVHLPAALLEPGQGIQRRRAAR
jgi:multiple sugar transport system substrate-binding protein